MAHELSPAVERAAALAAEFARHRDTDSVRLSDWVLGLIAEDEGKPAILLTRIGADLEQVRTALTNRADWVHPPAPSAQMLFNLGREKSISLRADPTLTTEFVLLAVLDADPRFRDQMATVDVRVAALEELLSAGHLTATEENDSGPSFTVTEPVEQSDAGRVIDANLNRAREALRVLDDYARFILNDRVLTEQLKEIRHELATATKALPAELLLAARDTPGDVGTTITTSGEYDRKSPAEVAAVNLKRLQEALRSIEEYGKVFGESLGRQAEAIRYRVYSLERAIIRGINSRARLATTQLYVLLTGSQCTAALDWTIAEAAEGGAQVFQLREKNLSDRELLDRARNVRRWTREVEALFIVNDRPDIARLSEADGVHLGQDDLRVADARRILGPDALIGVSTHSRDQVRRAVLDGADYLGVGPTFPSQTKSFDQFPGLNFVRMVAEETSLPWFALGGITTTTIRQVVEAGARRVAVSAVIAQADHPALIARQLRSELGSPVRCEE